MKGSEESLNLLKNKNFTQKDIFQQINLICDKFSNRTFAICNPITNPKTNWNYSKWEHPQTGEIITLKELLRFLNSSLIESRSFSSQLDLVSLKDSISDLK